MKRRHLLSMLSALSIAAAVACTGTGDPPQLKELQRVQAGDFDVVVLSAGDALKLGKDSFVVEFRSHADQRPVDVGTVEINATMSMAGMPPMIGSVTTTRTDTAGRYDVTSDLGMAGSWRIGLEWDGPAGRGSTSLQGRVQ